MTLRHDTILPLKPKGDDSAAQIWMSVGSSLHNWEDLQTSLAELFLTVVRSNSYGLKRAFGYSTAVPAKIEMIKHAAEIELRENKSLKDDVLTVVKETYGFNDRRNDIAHGFVNYHVDESGIREGLYLLPSQTMTKKCAITVDEKTPKPSYCWVILPFLTDARSGG